MKEALAYEKTFMDSSVLLLNHLKGRPECSELLDEMRREEANLSMVGSSVSPARMADQTGAFRTIG